MVDSRVFDIVVAGGGIAGSCFAGVMARAGYGVLLVERETRFRDRVRGEATWPWGVAEARRCGLLDVYERADSIDIVGVTRYVDRVADTPYYWATDSIDQLPELGFVHQRLQDEAFTWAAEQGATTLRPAKGGIVRPGGRPSIEIHHEETQFTATARLVVGADGKHSAIRAFTGGETCSDPERYRFGGVLVTGVEWAEYTDDYEGNPERVVNWFPISMDHTRIYLRLPAAEIQAKGLARSFDACKAFASSGTAPGFLDGAEQAGPIAYFPNSDIWTTRVAGEGVTLIGDAAGSVDPAQGHGTPLLMRDVRELSEALIAERNWQRAIECYAERRRAYYDVLHAYDLWTVEIGCTRGLEGDRLREQNQRAQDADPSLGGWNLMEAHGPDGLTPDEAARRHVFGEDL